MPVFLMYRKPMLNKASRNCSRKTCFVAGDRASDKSKIGISLKDIAPLICILLHSVDGQANPLSSMNRAVLWRETCTMRKTLLRRESSWR